MISGLAGKNLPDLRRSHLCLAGGLLSADNGCFDFYGEVLAKPIMDAFFLAGVYDSLPSDVPGPLIIFGDNVGIAGQDRYNGILPDSTTIVGIVDYLAVKHKDIVTEMLGCIRVNRVFGPF
jgi:hypothetical protein